jgi:hypothetical protein
VRVLQLESRRRSGRNGLLFVSLPFVFVSLPFVFVSLPFVFVSLPSVFVSLPFVFVSLPFVFVSSQFFFLPLPLFFLFFQGFLVFPRFFLRFPLPLFGLSPIQRRRSVLDLLQFRGTSGDLFALTSHPGENLAFGRLVARLELFLGASHVLFLELQSLRQRLAFQGRLVDVAPELVVRAAPVEHYVHDQRRRGAR